jgi:outer membrane protein assembly factor BamB
MPFVGLVMVLTMVVAIANFFPRHATVRAASSDWSEYLYSSIHQGNNPNETILSASNVASLTPQWSFKASRAITGEPIIVGGIVYEVSWDGYMYAINAATHQQVWKTLLGTFSLPSCPYIGTQGPTATAVVQGGVVYIGSGNTFYALDAATGAIKWHTALGTDPQTANNVIWGAAEVTNGKVYVGIASLCDNPLNQGLLYALNSTSGAVVATFESEPNSAPGGGGIWSTPTVDAATGTLIVTTGSVQKAPPALPLTAAVVTLDWNTLAVKQSWQVPASQRIKDADFGSTPTLFPGPNGKTYIGCINKNSIYYVFDEANVSAGPIWQVSLGPGGSKGTVDGSWTASAYVNGVLFIATVLATVNGVSYPGSIGAFNALTGQQLWRFGTAGPILNGVITANGMLFDGNGGVLEVRDQATGKILFSYDTKNSIKGAVTVLNGMVYIPTMSGALYVLGLSGGSPPPSSTPSAGSAPVNKTWYFAEGRAGKGFREYLTIGNPMTTACAVNVKYLYTMDGSSTPATKTVSVTVASASRMTESVNNDLGLADSSASAASLAAIVTVNTTTTPNCGGVVAERPMYFSNYHGISSGTDVIGGTTLNTTYYFADVPTGSSSSGSYTSYLTILNPGTTTANVTVNYYANGSKVQSQTLAVPANARGTIPANAVSMPQHVAAVVTSGQPIMVERPTYFTGVNGVSGAYDVVGAPQSASDWLFAEGYTGPGYQEYLTIANLNPTNTTSVTVILKSSSGATNSTNLSVGPQSQMIWNVNSANTFSGSSPEVSAEVTTASSGSVASAVSPTKTPKPKTTPTPTKTPKPKTTPTPAATPGTPTPTPTPGGSGIVVERELYFTYKHTLPQSATGGTDVLGQIGPASFSSYSFAEGYTNTGYNEWLTIQNPTSSSETVYVTLVNQAAKSSTQSFTVAAHSRFTLDVTALIQRVFAPGTNSAGNSISMTVQSLNNSPFVAERPMYWNTSGVSSFVTTGGSDVIGYIGG